MFFDESRPLLGQFGACVGTKRCGQMPQSYRTFLESLKKLMLCHGMGFELRFVDKLEIETCDET
jgi:hypothetical protein